MSLLRFVWRAWWVSIWVLLGLLTLSLVFPWLSQKFRLAVKRCWARVLLRLCGVELSVSGHPPEKGPVLWVANHVSWLDVFVLNHVRSTTFIAKHEIRHWPVLGWLVAGADTIFIERGVRHAVHRVGTAMENRFEAGQAVGLFPEGTTSTGFDVLPFYANLYEPARRMAVPIQPIALLYSHQGQRSDFASFVGEESLMQNLWRVLGTTGVSIEMVFLPVMAGNTLGQHKRSELASLTRQDIRSVLLRSSRA